MEIFPHFIPLALSYESNFKTDQQNTVLKKLLNKALL